MATSQLGGEDFMIGLTSVTFRQLPYQDIIDLARQARLNGIEWGSDIHVPEGNIPLAEEVAEQTAKAGLRVISYGSYYRLGTYENAKKEFFKYLETASALKAPVIRVWAGTAEPDAISEVEFLRLASEAQAIAHMAEERGITVAFEYHRGTLTQDSRSALRLLRIADCANLKTYWQPNPDISFEENKRELQEILPYLSNIHVFHWEGANVRYPLAEGAKKWRDFISLSLDKRPSYIMEFVKDDSGEQFLRDAAALKEWLCVHLDDQGTNG